ncbi:MAG TPA: PilZ domain-containing protein [Ramlibacter sp.]|jgi:hypothetical protein|nr:PilZ domain-containing protein [Ramlibacter sp.]
MQADTAADPRDQRTSVRFDATMPVDIEGTEGATQNISAQGVCFETDVRQRVGELVNFSVEFTLYGRKHRLLCEGKVVRVDDCGDRIRVAARLIAPFFEGEERVSLPA